jgi:hemimethylated DNA binding protein
MKAAIMSGSGAASAALARALLKPLLRAGRALDARGMAPPAAWLAPAGGAAAAVRAGFRASVRGDGGAALDGALRALAAANAALAAPAAAAPAAAAPAAAAPAAAPAPGGLAAGTLFVHRTLGYRGVIIGGDARCRASGAWVSSTGAARLPHGTEQRFYRALVDARDRPRATISYVAEDNIIALAARREAGFIVHPLLRVAGRAAAAAATDSGSESEPEDDARRGLGVSA